MQAGAPSEGAAIGRDAIEEVLELELPLTQARDKVIEAFATHALLSGPAYDRIEASCLGRLIVTDTIPLKRTSPKIEVISVAPLFADAIRRIYADESISTLFVE